MTTAEAAAGAGAQPRGHRPIGDCAPIGDCHGAALVASDGSIDWATLHRFDADPVFCRLLAGAAIVYVTCPACSNDRVQCNATGQVVPRRKTA